MPSIDKLAPTEILSIAKKMFWGGFAFLPFLWLVNFMYLWPATKRADAPPELKKYLLMSLAGSITWLIILSTWFGLFVNMRVAWGAAADMITVVIPKGV
ncbi:gamma-secretase aspartyl protease complex, presenilin enhancer-2 subunit [Jimgerdemannia flammicorona]|uniref:Gamma-secretase aspartyl protease complex, presenilin enhancer-2 subunit n=2 Tax=Jimgerdemannia flammicorona TaxID=994334 RepID=A0A433QZC4_9FUNG|nr:gamma-secretase aspartyl protease complex, presenilin enhancer-2 subunit [Jimgerdemannia flammicorona]